MRFLLVALVTLAASSGCASPERAKVRWSQQLPVQAPERAARSGQGTLVVRTAETTPTDEIPGGRRGYAVFDRDGALVYTSRGYSTDADDVRLPPGEYIVVALVDEGVLDRELHRSQAVVERGMITTIDMREPGSRTMPVALD